MEIAVTQPDDQPAGIERRLRVKPPRATCAAGAPTVSVVIPCFNYGCYLESAVDSVLTQDGVEVEVVIVDDASTDDSLSIAQQLAADDSRIKVLSHQRNRGPVGTFNDGLRLADGEFLVRLDADDMLTPGALARATAVARAYPSVGLVYGHPRHFTSEPPEARVAVRSWTLWPGRQWLGDRCRDGLSVITAPEVVMRRAVVERVGGQQPLPQAHDTEMWMRIAAFADVAHVDGPDQAWHRDHPGSRSARYVDQISDLYERAAAFETLFAGPAGTIPEGQALHAVARRALARSALTNACHRFDRGRADKEKIAALTALACNLERDAEALPEWPGLQRRVALGNARVRRRPWYVAAAGRRRLRYELGRRRWSRTGAFNRSRPVRETVAGIAVVPRLAATRERPGGASGLAG